MNKIRWPITLIMFFLFLNFPISAEDISDDLYYHILKDLNTFSSFFPRNENSKGEILAADFIEKRLTEENVSFSRSELSAADSVSSWSSVIDAVIPGKSENEVFMIFPLNHPEGALPGKDGSAVLAAAVSAAAELNRMEQNNTIHIIFMGAEYGKSSEYPIGSRYYLYNNFPEGNSLFIYFDLPAPPDKVDIGYYGTGRVAPLWLLKKSISDTEKAGIEYSVKPAMGAVSRLGLNDRPSVIDIYLENGYPAILYSGNVSGNYTTDITKLSVLYNLILSSAGGSDFEVPSDTEWDSHYFFFKAGSRETYISERAYVIFLITLLSALMIYPFTAVNRVRKYRRILFHNIWNIPVAFFIMFLLLWISTVVLHLIFRIQTSPDLWREAPLAFLALKLSISVLLFMAALRLFRGVHFSRRGTFYSAAAMIFIILDLLILLSVDIAFTYYIIPLLIFIFLFTISGSRWVKLVFFILSLGTLAAGMITFFLLKAENVIELILLSPVRGNLFITANILPVTLMLLRLQFLFHPRKGKLNRILITAGDLVLGMLSIFLFLYLAFFDPYRNSPQPLNIMETVDLDTAERSIILNSPAPIGNVDFISGYSEGSFKAPGTEYRMEAPLPADLPEITLSESSFLNRSLYTVGIIAPFSPESIKAVLTGNERIILFDSNFSSEESGPSELEFLLGANPKMPLEITFTLPSSFRGDLSLRIVYSGYPSGFSVTGENFFTEHSMLFEKNLSIGNSD